MVAGYGVGTAATYSHPMTVSGSTLTAVRATDELLKLAETKRAEAGALVPRLEAVLGRFAGGYPSAENGVGGPRPGDPCFTDALRITLNDTGDALQRLSALLSRLEEVA